MIFCTLDFQHQRDRRNLINDESFPIYDNNDNMHVICYFFHCFLGTPKARQTSSKGEPVGPKFSVTFYPMEIRTFEFKANMN